MRPNPQNLKPFPKGTSGNPGGRPKKTLQAALEAELADKPELLVALIKSGLKKALQGDFRYWKELFDRIDGKVPTPVEVETKQEIDWSAVDIECDTPALPDE